MPTTFPALLTGDQLQWTPSRPAVLPNNTPIRVNVIYIDEPVSQPSLGENMAVALEQLSKLGSFSDIDDPVEWQRSQRSDRSLPGRD